MSDAKISLCMIVGNVEEYILRCLESFSPIADEIVLVRAVGAKEPDRTIALAVEKYGAKVKIGEYRNAVEHANWPHVDNFAAARQQSYDLATGEYCFWCDSDDVLENAVEAAKMVRQLAERGGYAAFTFPYRILGKGVVVARVRMMLREAGRWKYPVHEDFDFHIKPVHSVEDNRIVVLHLPNLNKSGSSERNLRILESIPDAEMSAGLLYHLQSELVVAGEIEESIEVAKHTLAHPDLGRHERYELFLNLAQSAKDAEAKAALWHQAYAVDPRRREALGMLVCHAMDTGANEEALSYALQMMATQTPKEPDWNSRAALYGWLGDDICAQAMRCNGIRMGAEAVRREALVRAGGPRIALVHATRGRPQQAAIARKIWLDLAERPDQVEHIFCLDGDDEDSDVLKRFHTVVAPPGGGCVRAWNYGTISTMAPVVVQLSDDWIPIPQWDKLLLDRIGDPTKPSVLAISDGHRKDNLLCMAICTRAYLMQDYFMFHPWFTGVYSDNWFTDVAYRRGQVIEAKDIVFVHNHPAFGTAKVDQTYMLQNSPGRYQDGLETYEELKKGNDFTTVPGWFNFWFFYQDVAAALKDGDTVAEVGVWFGRSLIYLAQECRRRGKKVNFIAVDNFKGEANQVAHAAEVEKWGGSIRPAFEANLKRCGVADCVRIIEADSADAADKVTDGSLAMCFIDAAHDRDSACRDITAWKPKVCKGGLLAGHDITCGGVEAAVKELVPDWKSAGDVWWKTPA